MRYDRSLNDLIPGLNLAILPFYQTEPLGSVLAPRKWRNACRLRTIMRSWIRRDCKIYFIYTPFIKFMPRCDGCGKSLFFRKKIEVYVIPWKKEYLCEECFYEKDTRAKIIVKEVIEGKEQNRDMYGWTLVLGLHGVGKSAPMTDIALIFKNFLKEGYTIQEILDDIKKSTLLLDPQMPEMSGVEIAEKESIRIKTLVIFGGYLGLLQKSFKN